jgi:hypothetical protein
MNFVFMVFMLTFNPLVLQIVHICCIAGCWIRFPNDAAYALANYGHFCTTLLGFFSFSFAFTFFFGIGQWGR